MLWRMNRSDFSFELPEELIAAYPCEHRSASRLLQVSARGEFSDRIFHEVAELLAPDDLVVVNDSRVIRARLTAYKDSGGKVEVLVERVLDGGTALVQTQASKSLRAGACLAVGDARLRVLERREDMFVVAVESAGESPGDYPGGFNGLLARSGEVPLPPYLRRRPQVLDTERYQTVYAEHAGSVAAPTAGLHFDWALLERLADRGVETAALTLHIGAGTFQPLRAESLDEHVMHEERLHVGRSLCDAVSACRCRGGRIVAVGTTVVRALETAAATGKIRPFDGVTDLFIHPGYRFRVSDVMITNFHLPETSLFVLVCAFAGRQRMFDAYRHAIERRYRFFSYGDAMWLERR